MNVEIDSAKVAAYCRRNGIRTLEVFGSALRDDFRPESDIDLLVEFEPGAEIGLFEHARIARELGDLLGRKVDLVSKKGLKPRIRDEVLAHAEPLYAA